MEASKPDTNLLGVVSALIVDDSTLARRRFVRIAEETNLDFFLKEASSVQEFGTFLDQDKFDVIFVDLHLEADNGLALLPITRQHHVNKDAALIMIANDSHADTALAALRTGFADYIEKDALSSASLERATVNAVQKSRLSQAAISARGEAALGEALLASFAHACDQEMRPLMARMMRHIREVKPEADASGASEIFQHIEADCTRINEFFLDIETLGQKGDLSEFVKESLLDGQEHPHRLSHKETAPSTAVKSVTPRKRHTPRPTLFAHSVWP